MGSTGSSLTYGRHVSHSKPMSAPRGNPRRARQEMPNTSMTALQNARGSVHTSRDKKEPRKDFALNGKHSSLLRSNRKHPGRGTDFI